MSLKKKTMTAKIRMTLTLWISKKIRIAKRVRMAKESLVSIKFPGPEI
jgi:hypothetical protein